MQIFPSTGPSYQAHSNALVRLLSCTRVWGRLPRPLRTHHDGAACPSHCPFWLCTYPSSAQLSPRPRLLGNPSSGQEWTSTNLALAVAERGQKNRRPEKAPIPQGSRRHLKENLVSSVSRSREWEGTLWLCPEDQKRTVSTQDWRAWCKQPPSAGRLAASIFACWPLV